MNRLILSVLIVLIPVNIFGQLFPLSDNYVYDALDINPAFAGCLEGLSATVMYRDQWIGLEGAPKNLMLSIHTAVNNDRIGLGLLIDENSIGINQQTNILGNYSYRIEIVDGILALGLGFGISEYQNSWNNLNITDLNDPELINNPSCAVLPTFNLGMYYYSRKYFLGLSVPLFLSNEINQSTHKYQISNKFSSYNYLINCGYKVRVSPRINFLPSLLIKYNPNTTIQIDYNTFLDFNNIIWLGVAYRSSNTMVGRLKVQINHQLKLVYSYDYDMNTLGRYENGSHEIGINYIFNYIRLVKGPRQFKIFN